MNNPPNKSRVKSPVKYCWEIFDKLKARLGPNLTRKYAIATAVDKGVAFYTARTQWQEWRRAGDPAVLAAEYQQYKENKQRERERQRHLPDHRVR